jgi:hypothetical protein
MGAGSSGSFGITQLEIRPFTAEADAAAIGSARSVPLVRNPRSVRPLTAVRPLSGTSVGVTGAVGLDRSWQGLNLFQERFANNGNHPLGTCGMARAPLGNWSTRISLVTP